MILFSHSLATLHIVKVKLFFLLLHPEKKTDRDRETGGIVDSLLFDVVSPLEDLEA